MEYKEDEIVLSEETAVEEVKESAGTVVGTPGKKSEISSVNWKQKLSSRKLWAAVLAAVFAVISAVLGEELPAEMVSVLRTGIYGLIAYIFGEGAVDVARVIAGNSAGEATDK